MPPPFWPAGCVRPVPSQPVALELSRPAPKRAGSESTGLEVGSETAVKGISDAVDGMTCVYWSDLNVAAPGGALDTAVLPVSVLASRPTL